MDRFAGYLAMGRSLRSVLFPPPKLWLAMIFGFVMYLLLYTTGLVTASTEAQAVGVSLMNYLWPALAILGSATPILSTVWMIGLFAGTSAVPISGTRVAILLTASVMIAVAVAFGRTASKSQPRLSES